MKKIAFTCSECGTLNVPGIGESWSAFSHCEICGSVQPVKEPRHLRTAPKLYGQFKEETGLEETIIFEIQKRGLLKRDLAQCTSIHRTIAKAVKMTLSSEEILRAALSKLPKARREALISADGLLTKWQREVLHRYLLEYYDQQVNNPCPEITLVTSIPDMVRHLEYKYDLPAQTTRPWIKKLKKNAYNRVRRAWKPQGDNL